MSDPVLRDTFGRPLASLRISVTDRCNMRCRYCMPEDEYVWLPRESILTFEEITRLVGVFASLGVHKVRLTGGEPLLRHDLASLVAMIARDPRIADLAVTTNGLLLAKHAADLRRAGLQRVTVSLDTLRPERMLAFAKSARHADVLGGIEPVAGDQRAPAERFRLPDGATFGIIASTTAPFCASCDRSRLTADGHWFLCLYAAQGIDLREPLRRGASDQELAALIAGPWRGRADRGAEERLAVRERGALYPIESLRADPHREMHTRGG